MDFFVVPLYGSILYDHSSRADEFDRIGKIIANGNQLDHKSVIIVGWNLSKFAILGLYINKNPKNIIYTDFMDLDSLIYYQNNDYDIYFLPEMLPVNRELFNIDLTEFGGKAIVTDQLWD